MIDVFVAIKSIVVSVALLAMGGIAFGCLLLLLFRSVVASFSLSCTANAVRRPFRRIAFLTSVAIACLYGGAKNEGLNGTGARAQAGLSGSRSPAASLSGGMADGCDDGALAFTSFGINSNVLSFSLSWATNCMQAKSWIELYERISSLTNPWMPRLVRQVAANVTNDSFSIVFTNGVPQASFYTARMDGITVDFPDLEVTTGAEGSRVFTSFGQTSFNVVVTRPERSSSFPPPDPAFAANPFHGMDGASFDAQNSTLTLGGYGTYNLPDGGTLVALGNPVVKFGSPHTYSGTSVNYDSSTGEYSTRSAYPLDSPALQRNWAQGQTPGTGCSCVPSVDFGSGLVISDTSSTALQSGGSVLPPGMWTDFEYEDGGVWVTLYNVTNIVWRKWQEHRHYPDNGGTSDDLTGPKDEDECGCGDVDSTEGSSMGSVRFRIPLGSPSEGIFSGFLYFDRSTPFTVGLSSFELLRRNDALVTDVTDGMVRTVTCFDGRGRRIVLSEMEGGVTVEVRDRASGELQHTWQITNEGTAIRLVKYSVLWNVMSDETYAYEAGDWIRTDNVSGLCERRNMLKTLDADGYNREENITVCAGKTAIHTITDSELIGTGASAVLRETIRREKGADDTWKVSTASYWNDPAHPRRHGSVRLEQGDDRAWCYRAYDDSGRLVFRLDQRDGSPVPPDSTDYSILNLPSSSVAFATTYDYAPLAGDDCKSNDCDKVRVETKYVIDQGTPILIGKTWKTYRRGTSDGYPTIIVTTERAASQTAVLGDAGNAVSVEARFDDESEAVPYVLRGELASRIDEDGMETRHERTDAQGVLRTVERRFFNGNEAKTRRVTERDWNYGNLLYEAEAISADGTEFGWARHVYDEKNRLRFTQYDDGSWETNAYSCCRLLWSIDRTGAKRLRSARTGTDRIYYADEDVYIADLPDDDSLRPDDWDTANVKKAFRITQHFLDGLGRETNRWVRSHYTQGKAEDPAFTWAKGAHQKTLTSYPQGVSDVSVTLGPTGCETTMRKVSTAVGERTETVERDRCAVTASVMRVVEEVRGGARVERRSVADGDWRETVEWEEYADDGCRRRLATWSGNRQGLVTNRVEQYDFLGRSVRLTAPLSDEILAYAGTGGRVLSRHDLCSGALSENLYDAVGELVGTVSDGVVRRTDVDYVRHGGELWKVETDVESCTAVTNFRRSVRSRLTGLSNALRSEVVREDDSVVTARETSSYDAGSKVLESASWSLGGGSAVVRSMHGVVVEKTGPDGRFWYYHDPWERTYFVHRGNPDGSASRWLQAFDLDAAGNVIADYELRGSVLENALVAHSGYDCRGNRIATTNAAGESVAYAYDVDGRATAASGDAYPQRSCYDADGRRTSLETTRNGCEFDRTEWTYDPLTGLCLGKTYADASSVAYTHTADGLPQRTTYPGGHWVENAYDGRRFLTGVTSDDDACCVRLDNDVFGRVVSASNAVARYGYSYAARDVVTNEATEVGGVRVTIRRQADAVGRLTALSVSGAGGLSVLYATNGVIQSVVTPDGVAEYLYDGFAADIGYRLTLTNGVSFERTLTRSPYLHGEILSVRNAAGPSTNSYAYAYDAVKRPITRNADMFAYNRRGEVASATVAGELSAYAYDFIGNATSVTMDGATTTYGANALNQYETVTEPDATFVPTYTPNGELAAFGPWTYAYDALSRLTEVRSNGILVASNSYDHQDRRVRLVTQRAAHTFIYDGWNVVLELVEHDNVTDRIEYYWGKDISGSLQGAGGVGGLLYLKLNGAIYVPFYDAYGNVMEYRAADGSLSASYVYDAFGRTISQSGPLADVFRFRYSTKSFECESGLYYYAKRFYSPKLRRWLNRDPIGENGGMNLYLYVLNNSVSYIDLFGTRVYIVKHFSTIPPPMGWTSPASEGETVFLVPRYKIMEKRDVGGKIRFEVEIFPEDMRVDVYFKSGASSNWAMSLENDHISIARQMDVAAALFKKEVEDILDCQKPAREAKNRFEEEFNRTIQRLKIENASFDKKGGKHDLPYRKSPFGNN